MLLWCIFMSSLLRRVSEIAVREMVSISKLRAIKMHWASLAITVYSFKVPWCLRRPLDV